MAADDPARYQANLRRAHRRGFGSVRGMLRAALRRDDPDAFLRPGEDARDSRAKAAAAIAQARQRGLSLEATSAGEGILISDVRFWFPEAVGPTTDRRTRPTAADRHLRLRPLAVEDPDDVVFVAIRGSKEADRARADFAVQWDYLRGRASARDLAAIEGHEYAGRRVLTDPDRLVRLGNAAAFELGPLYRELVG